MTQVAQIINLLVSIFEYTYFLCGCVVILVCIDWVQIERDREIWREG